MNRHAVIGTQKEMDTTHPNVTQQQAHSFSELQEQQRAAALREMSLQRALAEERDQHATTEQLGRAQLDAQQISLGR